MDFMLGCDPDRLERISEAVGSLRSLEPGPVGSTSWMPSLRPDDWSGADADTFRAQLSALQRRETALSQRCRSLRALLKDHAAEQRRASAVGAEAPAGDKPHGPSAKRLTSETSGSLEATGTVRIFDVLGVYDGAIQHYDDGSILLKATTKSGVGITDLLPGVDLGISELRGATIEFDFADSAELASVFDAGSGIAPPRIIAAGLDALAPGSAAVLRSAPAVLSLFDHVHAVWITRETTITGEVGTLSTALLDLGATQRLDILSGTTEASISFKSAGRFSFGPLGGGANLANVSGVISLRVAPGSLPKIIITARGSSAVENATDLPYEALPELSSSSGESTEVRVELDLDAALVGEVARIAATSNGDPIAIVAGIASRLDDRAELTITTFDESSAKASLESGVGSLQVNGTERTVTSQTTLRTG